MAARSIGDLRALRAEVDRGLRTRRFLGYRESVEWAHAARPVLTELEAVVRTTPSQELVELLERGISHVVKVIQTRADDSSGLVGDLARDLLDLHAKACDAGVADSVKLARWMIRFRCVEQDVFERDPVRYRSALGEGGLAEYRSLLAAQSDQRGFAARYPRESGSPSSTATARRSLPCSAVTSPDRTISFRSPKRWPSSAATRRLSLGPGAGSRRPAAGRPISSTTRLRRSPTPRGATRGARASTRPARADPH